MDVFAAAYRDVFTAVLKRPLHTDPSPTRIEAAISATQAIQPTSIEAAVSCRHEISEGHLSYRTPTTM